MIYAVKTLQPFSQRSMALFVCLYRNVKGLSTALFVLCHPVDLLAFNQKENISFYMLLQNSKRWYTVITDKRQSRAKGRRNPSLFFALFCFFLAGRELRKNWCSFFGAIKAGNPAHKSGCKSARQCCCGAREGKESTGGVPGRKGNPQVHPGRQCQRSPSGCHTPSSTHIKAQHLEIFVLWTTREFGKFSTLPGLSLQ